MRRGARRSCVHLAEAHGGTRVLVFVATKYANERGPTGCVAPASRPMRCTASRARVRAPARPRISRRRSPACSSPPISPRAGADYTHRIGRTGRAGGRGVAASFISAETHAHFRLIEKRHRLALPREQIAGFEPDALTVPAAPATGGVKGKRKSKKDRYREALARSQAGEIDG
jgi:ATP-dependent RNA helicase RhlE